MNRSIFFSLLAGLLLCAVVTPALAQSFYGKQYAVVIGINDYQNSRWPDLSYARRDAESMAAYLKGQGYTVHALYDGQATHKAIIATLQDKIAPVLGKNDAVLIFFAGHGTTNTVGGEDWGYIVPYDGASESSGWIDMDELRKQSRKMGNAKHQAFIMDSCYGGTLGTRGSGISPDVPNYLDAVSKRIARQILTAGGKNQEVQDGGSGGHSVFTGYLLKGLRDGLADLNLDGWVTFTELVTYVTPAATNSYQTPGFATLPGHEQGEFLLPSPQTKAERTRPADTNPGNGQRRGEIEPTTPAETSRRPVFRSQPDNALSPDEVGQMLKRNEFFCLEYSWTKGFNNPNGKGFVNQFEKQADGKTIFDQASGLMWQQGGSSNEMTYADAKKYIAQLNQDRFAGYSDWRLPTLEEAMSLMEAKKLNGDLYIDPLFDKTQRWCWTADNLANSDGISSNASRAWVVYFSNGYCLYVDIGYYDYVRAVR